MNTTTRIRVLIHCRGAGLESIKTLVSLSSQTVGPQRLNVVLASTDPESHQSGQAQLLYSALAFNSLKVVDARGLHVAKAMNLSAKGAEGHLLLLENGVRLAPRFLARCLEAMQSSGAQAASAAHTAGSPERTPLSRLRPFSTDSLVRENPIGPAALVLREAWEALGGLRPSLKLNRWDLWLRMALSGRGMVRLPELLISSPALRRMPPAQEGQAKAMLVVSSPGAFEPAVCRWAMALLRGDAWAGPFDAGRIPSPQDVDAMFAGMPLPARPNQEAWWHARTGTA